MSHHGCALHASEHLGTVWFCSHAGGERRCQERMGLGGPGHACGACDPHLGIVMRGSWLLKTLLVHLTTA